MRGVPEDRAKRDLHAAVEFLKSQPNVKKDRIGSIGWCMGGGYSLDVALQEPDLAATVINYGHLATDTEALKKINAPILGLFGGQDRGITPDDVHKFEQSLEAAGQENRHQDLRRRGPCLRKSEQQRRIPRRRRRRRMEAHGRLSWPIHSRNSQHDPSPLAKPRSEAGFQPRLLLAHCARNPS